MIPFDHIMTQFLPDSSLILILAWYIKSIMAKDSPIRTASELQATQKLEHLVDEMSTVLYRTATVFPFHPIPIEIVIEKTKVNVKVPIFFYSYDIQSVIIKEISRIEVTTNLWFGTLKIISNIPNFQHLVISYLWKDDALKIQKIIQGLMMGLQEGIDLSEVPAKDLRKNAERLGNTPATA